MRFNRGDWLSLQPLLFLLFLLLVNFINPHLAWGREEGKSSKSPEPAKPLLCWIAVQEKEALNWITPDTLPDHAKIFETLAKSQGQSVLYPLLDLNEQAVLSDAENALYESLNPLRKLALAYGVESQLIAKIKRVPLGWKSDWILLVGDNTYYFDTVNRDIKQAFEAALSEFKTRLAGNAGNNGAAQVSELETVQLIVFGINGMEHYAQVLDYLKKMPSVSNVEVTEISLEKTSFQIETTLGREALRETIAVGKLLIEDKGTANNRSLNYTLVEVH